MKRTMYAIFILLFVSTGFFTCLYGFLEITIIRSLAITFGTTAYHFGMRLLVGQVFEKIMKNKVDYTKPWYQTCLYEWKIYNKLKVKKWKGYVPTYDPDKFNIEKHSWAEIAQSSCQAELVHETIILLSFVPILFSKLVGALFVFIVTSIIAAMIDATLVMIQRYNRSRIMKLLG